ncbi:MAG: hypothetical protein ACPLXS_02365 [Candidatus Micrarchaeales archaeon]
MEEEKESEGISIGDVFLVAVLAILIIGILLLGETNIFKLIGLACIVGGLIVIMNVFSFLLPLAKGKGGAHVDTKLLFVLFVFPFIGVAMALINPAIGSVFVFVYYILLILFTLSEMVKGDSDVNGEIRKAVVKLLTNFFATIQWLCIATGGALLFLSLFILSMEANFGVSTSEMKSLIELIKVASIIFGIGVLIAIFKGFMYEKVPGWGSKIDSKAIFLGTGGLLIGAYISLISSTNVKEKRGISLALFLMGIALFCIGVFVSAIIKSIIGLVCIFYAYPLIKMDSIIITINSFRKRKENKE